MDKDELAKFKEQLDVQRAKIVSGIDHIERNMLNKSQRDASGDLSGYTLHMADTATDSYDREFSLGLATNAQQILYEIDEALKRIEEKRFGDCLECNKPINRRRLTAIPYASHCIECQSKEEHKRRTTGSHGPALET